MPEQDPSDTPLDEYLNKLIASIKGLLRTIKNGKKLAALILIIIATPTVWFIDKAFSEILKAKITSLLPLPQGSPAAIPTKTIQRSTEAPNETESPPQHAPEHLPNSTSPHQEQPQPAGKPILLDSGINDKAEPVVSIQYTQICGEHQINIHDLIKFIKNDINGDQIKINRKIFLAGGVTQQSTEGVGTSARFIAKFTVCPSNQDCPPLDLTCNTECLYSEQSSFVANRNFATRKLGTLIAEKILEADRENKSILQASICETK